MSHPDSTPTRPWLRGAALVTGVLAIAVALAAWKQGALAAAATGPAGAPEPAEVIAAAPAVVQQHQPTISAIGTSR